MKRILRFGGKRYTFVSGHMKRAPAEKKKKQLKKEGCKVRIIVRHTRHEPIFNVFKRCKR